MKDGGPVMTAAGQSVETFAALTGIMGDAGIKGSKAGTTLKNVMLKLAAPADKAKNLMKKLGITVADKNGDMRDALDILEDMGEATKDMGTQQRSAAFDTIIGKRAIAGANVVFMNGVDAAREYRKALEGAAGASAKMAAMMRKGLGVRLKVLQSSLIELGMKIIETFQEAFPNALDDTITAIQKFDPAPMIQGIKDMLAAGKAIYRFIVDWKPVIVGLIGAFAGLKVLLAAVTIKLAIMNFVLMLNPWILLAMAIGAVVALLWVYWDDIQKWAEGVISAMFGMTDELNHAFSNLANSIYNAFVVAWNWILDLFGKGINKVIGLVGSVSAVLGLDLDFSAAKKGVNELLDSGKMEQKKALSLREVTNKRREFMGLPTTTAAQDAEIGLGRNIDRDLGAKGANSAAPMFQKLVEEGSIKGFDPEENARVEVELNFKNLSDHFQSLLQVGVHPQTGGGRKVDTKINKSRAGAN